MGPPCLFGKLGLPYARVPGAFAFTVAMAMLAGVLFVAARVGKRSDTSLTVPQEMSASGNLEAYGPGFCTRSHVIFESEPWALAPLSDGEDFTLSSNRYLKWVDDAWGRCLDHDSGTEFVAVWHDAKYICYTGRCDIYGNPLAKTWTVPDETAAEPLGPYGGGFCIVGDAYDVQEIYASGSWELASESHGYDYTLDTDDYFDWVNKAWRRCRNKDSETEYVSVWYDASYRCYKGPCTLQACLLYTSPSPRDGLLSRMPSSA